MEMCDGGKAEAAREKAAREKAAKEKFAKEKAAAKNELEHVQPGLNSLTEAIKKAKKYGIKDIFLLSGMHDEEGEQVIIDFALKLVGENKDDVKIRASLRIKGEKSEDVFFRDFTVTGGKERDESYINEQHKYAGYYSGVAGSYMGASMHLKNVCVEKCGIGVYMNGTSRNTMVDCNVNNNKESGVHVGYGGCLSIGGSATKIHHNGTDGKKTSYGLDTGGSTLLEDQNISPSSLPRNLHSEDTQTQKNYLFFKSGGGGCINLKSLKKINIFDNGGGGNYGGKGRIETTGIAGDFEAWKIKLKIKHIKIYCFLFSETE